MTDVSEVVVIDDTDVVPPPNFSVTFKKPFAGTSTLEGKIYKHEEKLGDNSIMRFETPGPPHWATKDPELWKTTHEENIKNARAAAFGPHMDARMKEKQEEVEILKSAFNHFDADGSGSLDTDEVIQILTRVGGGNPMSEADAKEFIGLFDHDGSGRMEINECKSAKPWHHAEHLLAACSVTRSCHRGCPQSLML